MVEVHKIIDAYKAENYCKYVIAQEDYNTTHNFSDLMKMLDYGIASNMYTQEEIKEIIAKQDELSQKILIAQYGKYLIMQ